MLLVIIQNLHLFFWLAKPFKIIQDPKKAPGKYTWRPVIAGPSGVSNVAGKAWWIL
jgi:hypothetical protein